MTSIKKIMSISSQCGAGKTRILIKLLNKIQEDKTIKLIEKDEKILSEVKDDEKKKND